MLFGRCQLPLSSPRRLKLETDKLDLILTDIQMLVLDGYEAMRLDPFYPPLVRCGAAMADAQWREAASAAS